MGNFHRQFFEWIRLEGVLKGVGKYYIKELLSVEIKKAITLHSGSISKGKKVIRCHDNWKFFLQVLGLDDAGVLADIYAIGLQENVWECNKGSFHKIGDRFLERIKIKVKITDSGSSSCPHLGLL